MISSKKELEFFLQADRMMNRGRFTRTLKETLFEAIFPDWIMKYLRALRIEEFYGSSKPRSIRRVLNKLRLQRMAIKLGFSIAPGVFGYGLVIPHYGTIVVGNGNSVGDYCVLHTSTCITAGEKKIGNAFYLSSGAKVIKDVELGDGISVSSNSLVNKTFKQSNCLLGGVPATYIGDALCWYEQEDNKYADRVRKCEEYRKKCVL